MALHDDWPSWWWIVVAAGGGGLLLLVGVVVGICMCRRRRRRANSTDAERKLGASTASDGNATKYVTNINGRHTPSSNPKTSHNGSQDELLALPMLDGKERSNPIYNRRLSTGSVLSEGSDTHLAPPATVDLDASHNTQATNLSNDRPASPAAPAPDTIPEQQQEEDQTAAPPAAPPADANASAANADSEEAEREARRARLRARRQNKKQDETAHLEESLAIIDQMYQEVFETRA